MSMTALVKQLEDKGRNGDTILAHINPEEAQLLKEHGGAGTINPETGIMEFNILSDLWNGFKSVVKKYAPVIIPAIAIFYPPLIPMIGTYLGATGAAAGIAGAAALSAGITLASGGSLKDVLTSAALAGASAYMTPILGKTLTTAGAGQLTQIMVGSAATGAGYVALRGGSVKEMMAAAATGAASAYLGNVAKDAVAKMNNMMASGTSNTIQQKGATDAVFAASDAANLKAAGLSEQQIAQTLKATGLDPMTADYAAAKISSGMDVSTLAANIAAGNNNGVYNGEANTKSITAGNNSEAVQRVEDANFVAADAAQLKAQGLGHDQIVDNLVASGVDKVVANNVANAALAGQSAETIANNMVKGTGYLTSGKVYTNTTDTIARDLGQAMTAEQQKTFDALPLKDLVNNGTLTVDEAAVLGQQGVTPKQVTDLTKLGYSASDVSNMVGAGVDPSTLTTLANTKFSETAINDLLMGGVSANDISNASIAVANNPSKISVETATKLLEQGINGQQVIAYTNSGQAENISKALDSGLSTQTIDKLVNNGWDVKTVSNLIDSGQTDVATVTSKVNGPTGWGNWLQSQVTASQLSQQANSISDTGIVNAADAKVLTDAGFTTDDVKSLVSAGYTPSELVEMASTGVPAKTLTQLATTPIPEAKINDLLMSGVSANDIANSSQFIKSGQLTVDQATNLLDHKLNIYEVQRAAVNGNADSLIKGLDAGLTKSTIASLEASGVNVSDLAKYIDSGFIDANDVNKRVTTTTGYKSWANTQIANAQTAEALELQRQEQLAQQTKPAEPVQPQQPTEVAQQPSQPQQPTQPVQPSQPPVTTTAGSQPTNIQPPGSTDLGNGYYQLASGQVVQPMEGYNALIADSLTEFNQIMGIPNIPSTAVPTVDANGNQGYYDTATGQTLDSNGQVIAQQTTPTGPTIQEAKLSPQNQQIVDDASTQYLNGQASWEDVSARINNAVQADIDSGYLKQTGDGSFVSPDGTRYFQNTQTGMWDTDTGVQGGTGTGPVTAPITPEVTQPAPSQPTQPVTPAEPVTDYNKQAQQFAGSHGLKTTQVPDVAKAFENGFSERQLDAAFRQNPYGNWVEQFTQPTTPEIVVTAPKLEQPYVPIITPPLNNTPASPASPAAPVIPTQPAPVTVVSSSTRTTADGSVYRDDQKSDGTVSTILLSGPTNIGTGQPADAGEIVVTAPKEPPLSPPTQVVIPPGSSYVAPVEVVPPVVPPETPVEPPVDTTPYVPILTPPTTPEVTEDNYRGRYTLGAPIKPNIPNTLNPGWITNVPDYYNTTNPAQAKYYWGGHPYQTGTTFNQQLYNQAPNAPATPFGLGYAQTSATPQQIQNAMRNTYPMFNPALATGPVRP